MSNIGANFLFCLCLLTVVWYILSIKCSTQGCGTEAQSGRAETGHFSWSRAEAGARIKNQKKSELSLKFSTGAEAMAI